MVCNNDKMREGVLNALLDDQPQNRICKTHNIDAKTLRKHIQQCIPRQLAKSQSAKDLQEGDDLTNKIDYLWNKATAQIEEAERDKELDRHQIKARLKSLPQDQQDMIIDLANNIAANRRDVIAGINAARQLVELLGKLRGDIKHDQINFIFGSPALQSLIETIVGALEHDLPAQLRVKDGIAEWRDAQAIEHDPNGMLTIEGQSDNVAVR